jgi:hypothetical protein
MVTNEEALKANTSDAVTDTMDEIENIIESGAGKSRASEVLEKLRRVRRGYLDQKHDLYELKFPRPNRTT